MKSKMQIGIIGFGQMAQFILKFLKQKADTFVSDATNKEDAAEKLGVKFVPIEQAAEKDIVILAVPISEIKNCMLKIKNHLKKEALLLDICSVKINPIKEMLQFAPKNVKIVGTHPLFGPQSGARGIRGLKIVLCPARITKTKLEKIKQLLESFGLEVIICSAEEHDRAIAETQALEHFIGRALISIDAKEGKVTTPTFKNLLILKDSFKQDSLQLFNSIQKDNPFAEQVRKKFLDELNKINEKLK